MDANINTRGYWNRRFASGDWEQSGGRRQTERFARSQMKHLKVDSGFSGTLLDFACGLGDAMPVYRERFPRANLIGVDISTAAIEQCRARYGHLATFIAGNHMSVPPVDVIIASNVLEHLSSDADVAAHLLRRCRELYIIVPYRERIAPGTEHVNTYDETAFAALGKREHVIFASRDWSQYGWSLWFHVYAKNVVRPLFGKPRVRRSLQIMFRFARPAPGQTIPSAPGP